MIQKTCPKCNKVFEGYTEEQVNFQISVHTFSKHTGVI